MVNWMDLWVNETVTILAVHSFLQITQPSLWDSFHSGFNMVLFSGLIVTDKVNLKSREVNPEGHSVELNLKIPDALKEYDRQLVAKSLVFCVKKI